MVTERVEMEAGDSVSDLRQSIEKRHLGFRVANLIFAGQMLEGESSC